MTLEQAISTLEAMAEVNRELYRDQESDHSELRLYEAMAIDIVLKELEERQ